MSYEDRANLTSDPVFIGRLNACVNTEALPKASNGDPFSLQLMNAYGWGGTIFMPWISAAPGFDVPQDQILDAQLLAAVQASWDDVAALHTAGN